MPESGTRPRTRRNFRVALAAAAALAALATAAPAGAAIPPSLSTPGNCTADSSAPEAYVFCDDGVPAAAGGTVANEPLDAAITVPARYGGDGFTGLPAKDLATPFLPGADSAGDVALDVDVSIPAAPPPPGGYPLIAMVHGCCSGNKTSWEAQNVAAGSRFDAPGERWHYNNAWFASRGYVVLTYTSRGFVNGSSHGSTGEMAFDSRRFEINDFQSLACQTLAQASDFAAATGHAVAINPGKVVATGGSYGGAFAWMALTDPKWTCNADSGAAGTAMGLAAAAPRYGWSDLAYSVVPTGYHSGSPSKLPSTDGCDTGPVRLDGSPCPDASPSGIPKSSILGVLFGSGSNPTSNHTTFPASLQTVFGCVQGPYPIESNPACASSFQTTLLQFLNDASAYYQNQFFERIASDPAYRIPVFDAATFTDPLFPTVENRRMINRLLDTAPGYPLQAYYGDYAHFVQNKAKVWGDVCDSGGARHVCNNADFGGDFNTSPASLKRLGVTTRLNRFVDHYAQPDANPAAAQPAFDVTAELQVCPDVAAALGVPADEGGPQFSAPTFEQLARRSYVTQVTRRQSAASTPVSNEHAETSNPIINFAVNGGRCPIADEPAEAGIATYQSAKLKRTKTMIGATALTVEMRSSGEVTQLDARLYDVLPDGRALMVDRGPRRVRPSESKKGTVKFELHGNGWRFDKGHRIRVELTQDDDPYLHASNAAPPSTARIRSVRMAIPVRERTRKCENRITGAGGRQKLKGTKDGDRIAAKGGNDSASAKAGKDCVSGGGGRDKLRGGKGADKVKGGGGRDVLVGGKGHDKLRGGAGGGDLIKARDRTRDLVNCGGGRRDRAVVDRKDRVKGCELVR